MSFNLQSNWLKNRDVDRQMIDTQIDRYQIDNRQQMIDKKQMIDDKYWQIIDNTQIQIDDSQIIDG